MSDNSGISRRTLLAGGIAAAAAGLAGANPSHSPFSGEFVATDIPRIRSTSWQGGNIPYCLKYWLANMEQHKSQLYVSAGNPGHVTVPEAWKQYLAPQYAGKVITYGA